MGKNLSATSYLLEYVALASAFIHCCIMLFQGHDSPLEIKVLYYAFVLGNLLVNNYYRGTRIHLWPMISGFALYSVALLFEYLEELTFYYYYLMTCVTIMLVYFFGNTNQYSTFVLSGNYAPGCTETQTKIGANRVLIYYPVDKNSKEVYPDFKWAMDGDHMLKGLKRFAADIIPTGPFYFLLGLKQNVKAKAPIVKLPQNDKHKKKFIPIIFSHGVGNTMSWFSTICKDLASQGNIVFCIEHRDLTALHFYDQAGKDKYFKNLNLMDQNGILQKLGVRVREIDALISELNHIAKEALGREVDLEMDHLTLMGHGFGATTAINMASKDTRVKKVVTFDPWLIPLKEEIMKNKTISVPQPHCSVNSEIFQHQSLSIDNWESLTTLFNNRVKQNKITGNMLSVINNVGHMAFCDVALMLLLELRIVNMTPSFGQAFNATNSIKIAIDAVKAFFIANDMTKDSGSYKDLIARLESTKEITFDLK